MPRKRTHESFVALIREKRPDYEALSRYERNSTKVRFKHSCGAEFEMTPGHFLSGQGCPICAQESRKKKLSSGSVPKLLAALEALDLSLAESLTEYRNNRQHVKVRCNRCGRVSNKTVGSILCRHGCKSCASRDNQPKYDIVSRLEKEAPDWELEGEYANMRTPALFLHKPCGTKYKKVPINIFANPNACRFCNAKRLSGTHEGFLERVKHKADYEVLSPYINSNTKIHIRHALCGHDFWCFPLNFAKREEGCPFCKNKIIAEKATSDPKIFENIVAERGGFRVLTEYKGMKVPIKMLHEKCGKTFLTVPANFCRSSGCPYCHISLGEKELYDFVCSLTDDPVVHGDRIQLPYRRELDIYLPSYRLAFEFDGVFTHTTYGLMRSHAGWDESQAAEYSLWKTRECRGKGIRLIHFYEDEWLEKRPIVEDKVKTLLRVPQEKLFARKLVLQPIAHDQADKFYDKNHIQGKTRYSVTIGLLNGERLVAAQSFIKGTRGKEQADGDWELVRYATELGTVVVGGFSKCLKWFEKEYKPRKIVSFADLRICDPEDNVYEKNGFKKDNVSKPDFYYVKGTRRFHKSCFRKANFKRRYPEIYSPSKTESQMAKEAGLLRIYDCGKIRYVKTF